MKIFLDSSVVIAACGRSTGASRALFDLSDRNGWVLQASSYVIREVAGNLPSLPALAREDWSKISVKLKIVPDVVSFDWVTVFTPAKDRPILFTAVAWADILVTLDRHDFLDLLGSDFYGMPIMKPGDFLFHRRNEGRLIQ